MLYAPKAQNAITHRQYPDLQSFESFQERRYQSVIAEVAMKGASEEAGNQEILLLLSEMNTGKHNAKKVERWIKENPKHPMNSTANYHAGAYFFYERDQKKSNYYLSKVSHRDLNMRDQSEYGFMYGILKLAQKQYKDAKRLLEFSSERGFEDSKALHYYLAYANYHLGNQENALAGFEKVADSEYYGNSSKYFLAKIQLEQGNTSEVIALASSELSEEKSITNSAFYQLIGEAYAQQQKTAQADAFFEKAIEVHPNTPSAALYYQAGISKFKIGNEEQAIDFLTKSGLKGGEYAQLSALQLGRLYLKKQQYKAALTAYIEATASSDSSMKEEALFHASTIHATLEQYTEAIEYANDYLEVFRDSERAEQVQDLIAQAYLKTSNYDLAIEHLKATGVSNQVQQSTYQKVTFRKAVLAFNDGNFEEANQWFNESLKFTPDASLNNQTNFYLGELALRKNQYQKAISHYTSQSALTPQTHYGLGYAYFNTQSYQKAIPHFKNVQQIEDQDIMKDATVRLADCLYATKSYTEALNVYNKLLQYDQSSYLSFQKGMVLKEMNENDEAISSFRSIFSSPQYGSEARFQVGIIHLEGVRFSEAEKQFSYIIDYDTTKSPIIAKSFLNRGIAHKNMGQLEQAKEDYLAILNNHINSNVAINAILGLQELQQSGLAIPNMDDYILKYRKENPESESLEVVEFEAAKGLYFDFEYDKAIRSFTDFIKNYPTSSYDSEAKYYLADSYYRAEQFPEAKEGFNELKYLRNSYTGRVLARLGELNKLLGNIPDAKEAYELLYSLNLSVKDNYQAKEGLMQLHFDHQNYHEAIEQADELLKQEWKPLNGEQKAVLIKGKSWYELQNQELAQINFKKLIDEKDIYSAEATYYLALIQYQQDHFDESLTILFDLTATYGNYAHWKDLSYLLIAKNYIGKEELFQAKATLRSIVQHASSEEVKEESENLLFEIEQQVNNSDSSQTGN